MARQKEARRPASAPPSSPKAVQYPKQIDTVRVTEARIVKPEPQRMKKGMQPRIQKWLESNYPSYLLESCTQQSGDYKVESPMSDAIAQWESQVQRTEIQQEKNQQEQSKEEEAQHEEAEHQELLPEHQHQEEEEEEEEEEEAPQDNNSIRTPPAAVPSSETSSSTSVFSQHTSPPPSPGYIPSHESFFMDPPSTTAEDEDAAALAHERDIFSELYLSEMRARLAHMQEVNTLLRERCKQLKRDFKRVHRQVASLDHANRIEAEFAGQRRRRAREGWYKEMVDQKVLMIRSGEADETVEGAVDAEECKKLLKDGDGDMEDGDEVDNDMDDDEDDE